jgi:hypothetical protein
MTGPVPPPPLSTEEVLNLLTTPDRKGEFGTLCKRLLKGKVVVPDMPLQDVGQKLLANTAAKNGFVLERLNDLVFLSELTKPIYWQSSSEGIGLEPRMRQLLQNIPPPHGSVAQGQELLYRGVVQIALGNSEAGFSEIKSGIRWLDQRGWSSTPVFRYARGVLSPQDVRDSQGRRDRDSFPGDSSSIRRLDANSEIIFLAAGDINYFEQFLSPLARSLSSFSPSSEARLHLHLVALSHSEATRGADLINRLRPDLSLRLSFSHEIASGGPGLRTYFAFSRFLVAEKLLVRVKGPVMVLDLDIIFDDTPRGLIEAAAGFDVSFRQSRGALSSFPWFRTPACPVVFSATDESKSFLSAMNDSFLNHWDPNSSQWGMDQNLLTATTVAFDNSGVKFGNIKDFPGPVPFRVPYRLKSALAEQGRRRSMASLADKQG